jgi:hypothetical protein
LALTDRGRAILARAPEPAQERLIAALDALNAHRRQLLGRALDEVARTMGASDEPPMLFEQAARNDHDGLAGLRHKRRARR